MRTEEKLYECKESIRTVRLVGCGNPAVTIGCYLKTVEIDGGDSVKIRYDKGRGFDFEITKIGDTVEITERISWYRRVLCMGFMKRTLQIEIPKGVNIEAQTSLAAFRINTVVAEKIHVKTANAKVEILNSEATDTDIRTSNSNIVIQASDCGETRLNSGNAEIRLFGSGFCGLSAKTSNAAISMESCGSTDAELETSNAPVTMRTYKGDNLKCQTSNGKINVTGAKIAEELFIKTSNAGIELNDSNAKRITGITANAKVRLDKTRAEDYNINTSNGYINLYAEGDVEEYNIDVKTSNGHCNVLPVTNRDTGKQIRAKTSNSNITLNFFRETCGELA